MQRHWLAVPGGFHRNPLVGCRTPFVHLQRAVSPYAKLAYGGSDMVLARFYGGFGSAHGDKPLRSSLRRVLAVLAVAVACWLIAATAYAAIPDGSGTFNGCVNKITGFLRVVDPSKGMTCFTARGLRQETAITWSQRGPQGPPGPSGGLTSLDQLSGLPCNVNSPDRGNVTIEYDQPQTSGNDLEITV